MVSTYFARYPLGVRPLVLCLTQVRSGNSRRCVGAREGAIATDHTVQVLNLLLGLISAELVVALRDGAALTLAHTRSHYLDADLGRISKGFAAEMSKEEMVRLHDEVKPQTQDIVSGYQRPSLLRERFAHLPLYA